MVQQNDGSQEAAAKQQHRNALVMEEVLKMIKRTISITTAIITGIIAVMILISGEAFADSGLTLDRTSIDMDKLNEAELTVRAGDNSGESIEAVSASKKGIVAVELEKYRSFTITAIGKGDTTLKVTGDEGSVVSIPVHVGAKALKKSLKSNTDSYEVFYGTKKLNMTTIPGAKVTVKIGKAKYTATAPKLGDDRYDSDVKVKFKKLHDVRSAIRVSVKKDGVSHSFMRKIVTEADVSYVGASKKNLEVVADYITKGDKLTVKYAGKTYTRKAKKSKGFYTFKIKTRKAVKKNAKLTFTLRTKYGTKLSSRKVKLQNGEYSNDLY